MRFTKEGYESVELQATQESADAALQRVIRVSPGETVTPPRFAPNDLSYTDGSFQCRQCRLVRLVSDRAGTLHIQSHVEQAFVTFTLWAGAAEWKGSTSVLEANVPVLAGETVAYLGKIRQPAGQVFHVPVTIEATMP